ncbi:hypothetical protein B6V73_00120 [Thioclava sp. JM3]|nr:hypothetical protein B6V73_00120 [Thioclava sp. JM3]
MVFGVSPWNHSFEADFNDVDREAPVVLRKLRDDLFEAGVSAESLNLNIQEAATLVAYCFSVLLRSPAYRHRMSFAGVGFGLPQDERVGRANVQQAWSSAKTIDLQECNRADLRLLVSRDAEFIFADGLVDGLFSLDASISWRAVGQRWIADLCGEALVPLLPNLCAYLRFSRSGLGCRVKTIDVEPDVTSSVNALTQIYAKDDLFFRSETPTLTRDFICGEHRELKSFEIELMRWLRST